MKNILLLLTCLLAGTAFAQENKPVTLEWKIAPGDTLSYKTAMTVMEDSESDPDAELKRFFESVTPESERDNVSDEDMAEFKEMFSKIRSAADKVDLTARMTNNGNNIIGVFLEAPQDADEEENDTVSNPFRGLMGMMGSIMLRGSVYSKGGIHSFWVKNEQKNLIAMFFELPKTPVRKGDSWPIEINFISNDQNFECTESRKTNKVTLTDIKNINGETIAVLEYDMEEYVRGNMAFFGETQGNKTMMHFTFKCKAEFSIEKGRWVGYEGELFYDSTAFMGGKTKKRIALIEE